MKKNTPIYLVVHHCGGTDTNPLADTSHHTFEMVDAWHRENPNIWLGELSTLGHAIGYHYFIDKTGRVTQGRADTDEGAHCKGYNTQSIGICLAGNFDVTLPTPQQVSSFKNLLVKLSTKYNIPVDKIVPHRKFVPKTCYGKRLPDNWASDLIKTPAPMKRDHAKAIELLRQAIDLLSKQA